MDDLISRQGAIDALLEKGQKSRRYKIGEIWELNFDEIREALATVPSADPKKGKWAVDENLVCVCSECGYETFLGSRYCPNCGADMRESE